MECVFCGKKVPVEGKIGRRDTCPHCQRDLRCCKQCKFFDQHAYNECKEVLAERISNKERSNFCDYSYQGFKGNKRGYLQDQGSKGSP